VHYYLLSASDAVSPDALKHVRMAISTSMKLPPEIGAAFTKKFALSPREAYGIIEIGLPFINTDAPGATGGENTVGRLLPDYQLRIDHADERGVGEVWIKGKGMFDGYFSPWRPRNECMDDGWFHTGDLGRVDEHGRLALLGRSKTVIVCAGMKVFPEEVEHTINAHPQVRESLVRGREHPQFGQVPIADVILAADVSDADQLLADLRSHCFARLSSYKVPVEFRAVDSLPRTPSGKLARAGN
jgi:long-chain acyl-CoA synthetase